MSETCASVFHIGDKSMNGIFLELYNGLLVIALRTIGYSMFLSHLDAVS